VSDEHAPVPTSRAITRRDLELVVRRAVELATEQADAGEAISEEEVVRIGREVGLDAQYVRQALFDLPALQRDQTPTLATRTMGPCDVVAQRVLPPSCPPTIPSPGSPVPSRARTSGSSSPARRG
jgi:hypothetical protein